MIKSSQHICQVVRQGNMGGMSCNTNIIQYDPLCVIYDKSQEKKLITYHISCVAIGRLYIYTSYGIIVLGFMYYAWDGSDSIIVLGIVYCERDGS